MHSSAPGATVVPEDGFISFARGIPSPDLFPLERLAECAARAVSERGRVALNYGDPRGYLPLREWLGDRHAAAPDQVVVTPGSLVGLNFVVAHLLEAGGRAVVEAPTYDRMLHSLRAIGAEICAVERNDEGLDLDRLRDLLRRKPKPSFLYVVPTFHNPTGHTMTPPARDALAAFADEHDLMIFEDDAYGLLGVDGIARPPVYELLRERGRGDLAIYASSFSKTVAPGLRVGYLLLPEALVPPVSTQAMKTYVSPPLLPQAQLLEFLSAGYFEPQLDFVRAALGERRDALLTAFDERMPTGARWTRPDGGYFVWLELPAPLEAAAVDAAAQEAGVTFVPGSAFFPDGRGRSAARIAFSYPSVPDVREGAVRLAGIVRATVESERS